MTFGDRLRELRLEKNLTQEELGKIFEKSKNNISQYELNKRQADDEFKKQLSDFFDCTIDYLLGYSDIRKPKDDNPYNLDKKDLELFNQINNDPDISLLWHDLKNADREEIIELLRSWDFIKAQFKRLKEMNKEKEK